MSIAQRVDNITYYNRSMSNYPTGIFGRFESTSAPMDTTAAINESVSAINISCATCA